MEQPQRKQNPLETEPIGRLIRRYSIPTALTLMVNYLYNIVDQIFVGQGVGVTGMAATNVAFPLTIVTIALALMIGDGCAANMSLCLGRRQQEEADRTASHTVTLLVAAGVFLAVAGSLFARQIVLLFGATETAFQASLDYTRIIVWGLPFLLFSSALTAIIRADGNPKYTMKCMILGAVINTVLDPVFIFGLHMGVVGAAIATVIGQVAAGGLCLVYQIAHAMFVGVSSATQPINGYNFGAKRYDRVRATYRMAATIALAVSVGWFAVYQLFPRAIGTLFVSGDPVYLDACQHIFRVYMLAFFLYGIHMATSSFFQGIGRPVQALAIPLVRQAVVLIPLALLLSQAFGFNGALLAAPIADVVSFLLSLALVLREFRRWKKQGWLS